MDHAVGGGQNLGPAPRDQPRIAGAAPYQKNDAAPLAHNRTVPRACGDFIQRARLAAGSLRLYAIIMLRTLALWLWLLAALACTKSEDPASQTRSPTPVSHPKNEAPANSPSVVFTPPSGAPATVYVEVAREPAELQKGLMYRRHMGWDRGMLFVFPREQQQSFWMKNTLIPLDMIFVRSDLTVLGVVHDAEPKTLTSRRVEGPSQFVIETNAGWAKEKGIVPGTRVELLGVELP
jgi:uncharacterized membrane protein (UPF0127 family)